MAAIATVGASMAAKSQCKTPTKKLSVLMISGEADPLVPFRGGDVRLVSQKSRGSVIGVEEAAQFWRELDGLAKLPARRGEFPKLDANDKTRATFTRWGARSEAPSGRADPHCRRRARRAQYQQAHRRSLPQHRRRAEWRLRSRRRSLEVLQGQDAGRRADPAVVRTNLGAAARWRSASPSTRR